MFEAGALFLFSAACSVYDHNSKANVVNYLCTTWRSWLLGWWEIKGGKKNCKLGKCWATTCDQNSFSASLWIFHHSSSCYPLILGYDGGGPNMFSQSESTGFGQNLYTCHMAWLDVGWMNTVNYVEAISFIQVFLKCVSQLNVFTVLNDWWGIPQVYISYKNVLFWRLISC